jgi:hypothetical protein
LQGTMCATATPRAAPLATRWLRRAVRVRPRVPQANGQPGCTGGRRDALELRGNPHLELAVAAQLDCCELPGLRPERAAVGTVTGRRDSPLKDRYGEPERGGVNGSR